MISPKQATSFRLSDAAKDLLAKLAKHMGVSQTAVVEILLREKAKEERVK